MARADRERRRSWCCRGRRRGAGVGGEERVPSRSRAASLGGARGPAGVRQFAERPHSAGLPAPGRGWDSWPRRRSRCTDGRGVGACTMRRGSRLGGAGGRPGVAGARGGESHVSRRRRRRWGGGGESLWPGAAAASVWRGEVVLLLLSGGSDLGFRLTLGAGDGRLGLGLGGFPLKEVVGHLKAQSTCF